MSTYPVRRIPARYVGHQPAKLRPGQRYLDGAGAPRESLLLNPGDTLMVPETEVLGQTYVVEQSGLIGSAEYLGVGRVLLPEHAAQGLTPEEMIGVPFLREGFGGVYVYKFHDGRGDFEPIAPEASEAPSASSRRASRSASSQALQPSQDVPASSQEDAPAAAPALEAQPGE